nr:reverse transcriptase domain-containing protein [Tanacetum cinerariifolium]
KDYAKITKKESKPNKIKHEIAKNAQKLDQMTSPVQKRSNRRRVPNIVELEIRTIEDIVPMADRTMKELLQGPTEGYGEAIIILEILAENFEIKTNLLQDVPNDAIKLMLFPYSLEGDARIWYEKEPPNSILTWDDLTFGEAWEHFKEMLRACPHHGFLELTQIDTFYNGLNEKDQDSLNVAAGGNLLSKTTREALKIIKNKSKVRYSRSKSNVSRVNTNARDNAGKTDNKIDKLVDQILNLVEIVNKQVITPASAKAVDKTCVTCRGAHAYYDCIATDSNQPSVCAATGSYNQVSPPNRASHQIPPPSFAPGFQNQPFSVPNNQIQPRIPNGISSYMKSNEIMIKNMQNQINVLRGDFNKQEENLRRNLNNDMRSILGSFFQNQASTSGTLPSNIVPNSKGEMKAVTNRSGLAYEGPLIPANSNCPGSTAHIQPLSLLTNKDKLFELAKVLLNENCSAMLLKKLPKKLGDLDFEVDPRVPLILGRSFLRTGHALIDVYGEEITLRVNDESVTFNLNQTMRYSLTYDDNFVNRVDVIDIACEEFVQDIFDFQYNPKSSNPTLVSDPSISKSDSCKVPIVKSSSPTLTPFGESDFFLEEIENFLNDESIPAGIKNSLYDPKGDILYLEKLLNEDPFQIPPVDLKQVEETKAKSFIEEPSELELKELPSHLEYAFLEESNKLPGIPNPYRSPRPGGNNFHMPLWNFRLPLHSLWLIEWIVLGHKILKSGIEFDREKVDVIAKLHHPTTMKGVRSFLGHAGFYRRFIQDFSKIARPVTHLLEKETPFVFSKECVDAFDTLKKKLTEALILVVPGWNLPFELMCDASDFAIGVVLGQRKTKHFQPIHYASKRTTEAQIHYTTTEKEMFVVVYAFEKFRPYLILSKRIVYTDHSTLKYLLNKQDEKSRLLRTIISDRGTHFCNDQFTRVMIKYGVTHRLATAYHPQTNGQVEVSNCGLKHILERTVGENRASWAYWALKHVNFDLKIAGDHRKLQLNELNELRDQAYENSVIYKERTKKLHDSKIKNRIFNVGDQVLLFNSRLRIFSEKLKTRWSGPLTITQVFPYGTIELSQPNGPNFKVNGHRVKHYFKGDIPFKDVLDLHTFLMDK